MAPADAQSLAYPRWHELDGCAHCQALRGPQRRGKQRSAHHDVEELVHDG